MPVPPPVTIAALPLNNWGRNTLETTLLTLAILTGSSQSPGHMIKAKYLLDDWFIEGVKRNVLLTIFKKQLFPTCVAQYSGEL